MLKIDETFAPGGEPTTVFLRLDEGALVFVADDGVFPLPARALDVVMTRFGLPLEPVEHLTPVGRLELEAGRTLRHVRHLGPYDVIARDYLVYEVGGSEPVCALAITVAGALGHLARAAARVASARAKKG